MPRQEFIVSYLLYPSNYEKDVIGTQVPVSFSTLEDEARHVFAYFPVGQWSSSFVKGMMVAERAERIHDRIDLHLIQLADYKEKEFEATIEKIVDVEKTTHHTADNLRSLLSASRHDLANEINVVHEVISAERLDIYGKVETFNVTADRNVVIEGSTVHAESLADKRQSQTEAVTNDIAVVADRRSKDESNLEYYHLLASRMQRNQEAVKDVAHILLDRVSAADAEFLASLNEAVRKNKQKDTILFESNGMATREMEQASTLVVNVIKAVRHNKEQSSSLMKKMIVYAVRTGMTGEGRAGKQIKKTIFAARESFSAFRDKLMYFFSRENDYAARYRHRITYAIKEGHNSYYALQVIKAALVYKDAQVDHRYEYGEKVNREGLINHPVILGVYNSPEAVIQKMVLEADRVTQGLGLLVLGTMLADLERDKKIRELEIFKPFLSDGKVPRDSEFLNLSAYELIKRAKDSFVDFLSLGSVKKEHDSLWMERLITAIISKKEGVIHELAQAKNNLDKEAIISILDSAEIPKDLEALVHEVKMAWDYDKDNRPASMIKEMQAGLWNTGFDDLMDTWKPGLDYLDPPSQDYNYSKDKDKVYNENGVPYSPLGPSNLADVDVKTPVNHPLPEFSNVGKEETWVDIYTFQDVIMNIHTLFKNHTPKLAGMSGQKSLEFILKELYGLLTTATPWNLEYQRMFRFVRWYAERLAHRESITVLHRQYDDWTDGIFDNGAFVHPHTINNMTVQPNGVIESTSVSGDLEFSVENYIDGQYTMSASFNTTNPSSTSEIRLYIDGVLTNTFLAADGSKRLSFDVPMGAHTYRIEYTAEVGDIVKVSGFVLSGVHFAGAFTTQRDSGDTRGLRVINEWIQNLLSYYMKHHKDKTKGAYEVKQRKIWIH